MGLREEGVRVNVRVVLILVYIPVINVGKRPSTRLEESPPVINVGKRESWVIPVFYVGKTPFQPLR